jgi:hypothetical protein
VGNWGFGDLGNGSHYPKDTLELFDSLPQIINFV